MINYEQSLNPAQLEAVSTTQGPVLVIAGAGSGKTRTIVYRLAYLVEQGIPPESILLLTFTRKAATQMLTRAGELLNQEMGMVSGGTFHGFSYLILKKFAHALGFNQGFTVMDAGDAEEVLRSVRAELKVGSGDKSFPRNRTILSFLSKARNKEMSLQEVIEKEAQHLVPQLEDILKLEENYFLEKQKLGLVDFDDLLFYMERLLLEHPEVLEYVRSVYSHVMVDEYQDTNLVQARLARLVASEQGNIMVVGDDAQSIYGFRGADVGNILDFPHTFPGAKIIKLEQNYRSTQPVLDLTNSILTRMGQKFEKDLFSTRAEGSIPEMITPDSDVGQASAVLDKVQELSTCYPLHEIAVLFRSAYHAYPLEVELNKASISYQKFGGIRFSEAAHIKDVLSLMRMILEPLDFLAWKRGLGLLKGVGPKTAERLYRAAWEGQTKELDKFESKNEQFARLREMLREQIDFPDSPRQFLLKVLEFYRPILEEKYMEDYPRRLSGLEQLEQIAAGYDHMDIFLADMALENSDPVGASAREDALVLSTIHSAKGLEWSAVLVIDLVEDRFPSRRAMLDPEEESEEQRLLYVACTRAKEYLGLFVPGSIYQRGSGFFQKAMPSPFIRELDARLYRKPGTEGSLGKGSFAGFRNKPAGEDRNGAQSGEEGSGKAVPANGYCKHKIFGRGKIVQALPPNKYRVNFPGFGLKTISKDYLVLED